MVDLTPDFHRRDCSLPMGCKDLLEVLNLTGEVYPEEPIPETGSAPEKTGPKKVIEIGDHIQLKTLAHLLECKPYLIIGMLMESHIFAADADVLLTFEQAEKIVLKLGQEVRRLN